MQDAQLADRLVNLQMDQLAERLSYLHINQLVQTMVTRLIDKLADLFYNYLADRLPIVFQVGKEMLCLGHQAKGESEGPGFTFLMELLRGDY